MICAALLTGGCSDTAPAGGPSADEESRVEVGFRLEAPDTDTSLEPMTRASSYKEWFGNACRLLILKKTGARWIVDATQTVLLDADSGPWAELKLADALPPCSFGCELRPGDYRIVAAINWQSCDWNTELVPGKVVADDADDALLTPPLITYPISTHWMNSGYRQLTREVFIAVADFTVPKSGDLHSAGMPAVTLRAERRVAKFRVLLMTSLRPSTHSRSKRRPIPFRRSSRRKRSPLPKESMRSEICTTALPEYTSCRGACRRWEISTHRERADIKCVRPIRRSFRPSFSPDRKPERSR